MQAAARHRGNLVSWKEHHKDFRSLFKLAVSVGQVEKELLIGREDLVMGCYSLAGRMLIGIRSRLLSIPSKSRNKSEVNH